jgi:dienelactone hydrolase
MNTNDDEPRSSNKTVWIILAVLASVVLLLFVVCGGAAYWMFSNLKLPQFTSGPVSEGLEPQSEDYVQARKQFKTKLLHRGPAPQPWEPVLPPHDAVEVEFPSGNLQLKAWINPPPAGVSRKLPAVLFLHGGFAFGEEDWDMCQPFRKAGFVVMTPILRGENGQPGAYTMFYDEVDDVIAAAEFLARQPNVDASRIYLAGHSAGGTLTLLAAMTSSIFRAAASFSGSPDQVAFVAGQPEPAPFDEGDIREFQMRSPVAYASSFKCPVRLFFGSQEPFFRATSDRTAELAQEKGLDVQTIQVPGNHMTAVAPAMKQAIVFFQQK